LEWVLLTEQSSLIRHVEFIDIIYCDCILVVNTGIKYSLSCFAKDCWPRVSASFENALGVLLLLSYLAVLAWWPIHILKIL